MEKVMFEASPSEFKKFVTLFFENGGTWSGGSTSIVTIDSNTMLYIEDEKHISRSTTDYGNTHGIIDYMLIEFQEGYELIGGEPDHNKEELDEFSKQLKEMYG